jgi:hypothetical protein
LLTTHFNQIKIQTFIPYQAHLTISRLRKIIEALQQEQKKLTLSKVRPSSKLTGSTEHLTFKETCKNHTQVNQYVLMY